MGGRSASYGVASVTAVVHGAVKKLAWQLPVIPFAAGVAQGNATQ